MVTPVFLLVFGFEISKAILTGKLAVKPVNQRGRNRFQQDLPSSGPYLEERTRADPQGISDIFGQH
jgi:hypothetical protein